jgi:putative Holliday junction resolvase
MGASRVPVFRPGEGDVERCLGLDLGDRRIGVALSDPLGIVASPLPPVERVGPRRDLQRIRSLVETHEVGRVVVGLPIRMDGTRGARAEAAQEFVERLRNLLPVPVEAWDERLSTVEAERRLVEADVKRAHRRRVVDGVAASLILQSYLDYRNSGGAPR